MAKNIETIKSFFKTTMSKCRQVKNGGAIRGIKAAFGHRFVEMIMEYSLRSHPNKNLFEIKKQYPFEIKSKSGDKTAHIKADVALLYRGQPVLNVEIKDYADLLMHRRFIVDSYLISLNNKNVKHILFQLQNANQNNEAREVMNSHFSVNTECFCLTDIKRNSDLELHNAKKEITDKEVINATCFIKNIIDGLKLK